MSLSMIAGPHLKTDTTFCTIYLYPKELLVSINIYNFGKIRTLRIDSIVQIDI